MQVLLLFLAFGVASACAAGVVLTSVVVGSVLWLSRFRTWGIFVMLVPSLSGLLALATSWGAMLLCASMSERTGISVGEGEHWQILALWAWPTGFIGGGLAGAGFGTLLAAFVVRSRSRELAAVVAEN